MNAIIKLDGVDATANCRLQDTRISYDSSRRITTATITVMAHSGVASTGARYDAARYDGDAYSLAAGELPLCTILDGRDGVTKLFEGQAYAMTLEQSDGKGLEVFYRLEMNDYAAWLDRAVCWGGFTLTLPASDAEIVQALVGHFCPRIDSAADVAEVVPTIQAYDWKNKTARQVLDDMAALAGAEWRVDFDAVLHYGLAADAPEAPFALSTSPNYTTTFPVNVSGYKRDFSNPVNRCYVRGAALPDAAGFIEATYSDPVSLGKYGELQATVVDEQITTGWDAALRAKSVVLRYAYPVESGNFTIWAKDGLGVGQQVAITEETLGVNGWYVIRSLTMQWISKEDVEYSAQFGAAQPDLETLLRLIDQRTRWKTTVLPPTTSGGGGTTGPPPDGSVTDASIAAGGLHAGSIASVNANTIQGLLTAGQIQNVNASSIIGTISAGQISSVNAASIVGTLAAHQIAAVNATAITGSITAGQIGSVNAASITGVVVSSQLANEIIDNLAKYADALRPIPMVSTPPTLPSANYPADTFVYYITDGHFYKIAADGLSWAQNDNPASVSMRFYNIGAMNATNIIGLILAGQIQSITAGQITGSISAAQIGSVNASVIAGQVTAAQIASVNATAIQGTITASQIASVNASSITGTIAAAQIGTITASQITGTLAHNQIGSINAATITIGLVGDSQISGISGAKLTVGTVNSDKLNTYALDVGDPAGVASNLPGRIRIWSAGAVVAQMGYLGEVGSAAYGGWFKMFGAAGSSWADARVYTDASGNLFLRNVDLNISGKIVTSTTTFDATYSTLALKNTDGLDSASFIARGLVVYYNGTKVGYFGRAPGGGWAELDFPTGGAYVHIAGDTGVRSDAGYLVGGSRVINSSGQYTGAVTGTVQGAVSTSSSIFTSSSVQANAGYYGGGFFGSSVSTSGACSASGGFSGGAFTGAGVNCPSYGIGASGFNPAGYSGQTWTIAWRDNSGNPLQLWINGVNQGQVQLKVVGGVVVATQ